MKWLFGTEVPFLSGYVYQSAQALIDAAIPPEGSALINPRPIAALLAVTTEAVALMGRDGRLPAPVRLSAKCLRYPRAEVRAALMRLLTAGRES